MSRPRRSGTRGRRRTERRPATPRELKELAEAGYVAAKTIALLKAASRGDRTAGFVGPVASAEGIVASQDRDEED